MNAILFDAVGKQFSGSDRGNGEEWAVRDLSFSVAKGEVIAVVGKTGCGKSTMFNLLSGLIEPSKGRIEVEGKDPYADFNALQGRIGIIFQNDRLMPWRTALDNVCLGLELQNKLPKAEQQKKSRAWLEKLHLSGYENAYPHELSGGMKQRVAISRAFALNPSVLLCDEPFSALDEITANTLRQEFVNLVSHSDMTAMFITHSIDEALTVASRVLVFGRPARVVLDVAVNGAETSRDRAKAEIREALAL
ncbi:MAG: ABC transporter ATP-binding protein [Rhodospirillales bacterium]|nr:ABC transporter ATP-binding protein [Rhodospirillales bacterium]